MLKEQTALIKSLVCRSVSTNMAQDIKHETNELVEQFFIENLPAKNKDDLLYFESFLSQNQFLKRFVVERLSILGGGTERVFVGRSLDTIASTLCLTQMSWCGTQEKAAFKSLYHVIESIVKAGQHVFPKTTERIIQVVETTVRTKIKNSGMKLKDETARALGLAPPRADYFLGRKEGAKQTRTETDQLKSVGGSMPKGRRPLPK